jgi:hypothetical protein
MKTKWTLLFILFFSFSFVVLQSQNDFEFNEKIYNKINSKKYKNGLYSNYENLLNERESLNIDFQIQKSLDTIIFEDNYAFFDIQIDSSIEKQQTLKYPYICYNDTFYYLFFHNPKKKKSYYIQVVKDIPYQTKNILIDNLLTKKKNDVDEIRKLNLFLFGIIGFAATNTAIKASESIKRKTQNPNSYFRKNIETRFNQWGSDIGEYTLGTFVFTPTSNLIFEASYYTIINLLEQKPHLKAQIDDKEMVDVGDGMQMPKYKYTRTTVYQLIEKLNDSILDNENVK